MAGDRAWMLKQVQHDGAKPGGLRQARGLAITAFECRLGSLGGQMPTLHTSELEQYVAAADAAPGGFGDPTVVARFEPLELVFDTIVDQTLSPYSDAYHDQQVALYREIAGRSLNQETGELHADDLAPLLSAPNPTGIQAAAEVAEHVRCVSAMLTLSGLGTLPIVLDMGAGHGLGSEVLAYAGCRVHAVDIDPALGALSRARAAQRDLAIERTEMNFDDLSRLENGRYDAAFFFQALHHSLRPWKLIAELKTKLRDDGIIAFCGEPVQDYWWKSWGIRLDALSLYVARARGWFESGWSLQFIRDCFERAGFQLTFFSGGFAGDEIGIATLSDTRREAVRQKARALRLQETWRPEELGVRDTDFRTAAGEETVLAGQPAYRQTRDGTDALVYGPYSRLSAGRYEVSMLVVREKPLNFRKRRNTLTIDVNYRSGSVLFRKRRIPAWRASKTQLLSYQFDVLEDVEHFEVRAFGGSGAVWVVSLPTIRRLR